MLALPATVLRAMALQMMMVPPTMVLPTMELPTMVLQMTVLQMLRKPFYHPTMEEALQGALRDLLPKVDLAPELPDAPVELDVLS